MEIATKNGLIYYKIAKLETGVTFLYNVTHYFKKEKKEKLKYTYLNVEQLVFIGIDNNTQYRFDDILNNQLYYVYWLEIDNILFDKSYNHRLALYELLNKKFNKLEIRYYRYDRNREHYIKNYYNKDLRIFKLNNILNV